MNSIKTYPCAHLATLLLIIGYPVFWLELYIIRLPGGQTSWLAPILFCLCAVWVFWQARPGIIKGGHALRTARDPCGMFVKTIMLLGIGFCLLILIIGLMASLLPPHLSQEFDALNYHITLPRQHLIRHSFEHIPWSTADLFLLPVDFALAPFWLVTSLPNKGPQFIFGLGLLGMIYQLVVGRAGAKRHLRGMIAIFCVCGSHFIGIQFGTAMLDLVLAYLFVAACDSWIRDRPFLCGLELAFYCWAKPFLPLQLMAVVLVLGAAVILARRLGFRLAWIGPGEDQPENLFPQGRGKRFIAAFCLSSLLVGGPFMIKSLDYAGTPLYPFLPGAVISQPRLSENPRHWQSVNTRAQELMAVRDHYGHGRGFSAFIKHIWRLAVPEQGVNNSYDYPVGLIYLLCLGPFCHHLFILIRARTFAMIPAAVCVLWALWWSGSQQSRFLYIPVLLLIVVISVTERYHTRMFLVGMIVALFLVAISVLRAHNHDFGKGPRDVLRDRDRQLLDISRRKDQAQPVVLDFPDVAYADFLADVQGSDSIFVLEVEPGF